MRTLIFIVAILGWVYASVAIASTNIKIAAVVENEAISTLDVNNRMDLAIFSSGLENSEEVRNKLMPQIIQVLIDEALYRQEAERLNINANPNDIKSALQTLEARNKLPPNSLEVFLKERKVDINSLKNQLASQIIRNKIIRKKVASNITITDREIEEKMENISSRSGLSEMNLSEIVLTVDKPENEEQIKKLAEKLAKEIKAGANFSAIAQEFSQSTTASNGGEIGWVQPNQLSKVLEENIKNLRENEITEPIRSADGYIIIKMNQKRALINVAKKESEIGLRQAFVPLDNASGEEGKQAVLLNVKKQKDNLQGCENFEQFANAVNSSIEPNLVMTQLKDLNDDISNIITALAIGQASPIVKSSSGVHVFMVCEKTEAKPSLAQRKKIREILMHKKIQLQAKKYIRNLRRNAFIEVRI